MQEWKRILHIKVLIHCKCILSCFANLTGIYLHLQHAHNMTSRINTLQCVVISVDLFSILLEYTPNRNMLEIKVSDHDEFFCIFCYKYVGTVTS
jgi:hypothetical protein